MIVFDICTASIASKHDLTNASGRKALIVKLLLEKKKKKEEEEEKKKKKNKNKTSLYSPLTVAGCQ